ncbi:hypothetical protein, partial [Legionella pneumophila]|uniref:hypothetical protein n=1 Tax=Legionella pneumophila TaxID=446 RepID=UPI001F167732
LMVTELATNRSTYVLILLPCLGFVEKIRFLNPSLRKDFPCIHETGSLGCRRHAQLHYVL